MARERRYGSPAERQAAYRERKRNAQPANVTQPASVTQGFIIAERTIGVRARDLPADLVSLNKGWNTGPAYTVACAACGVPMRMPPHLGAYVRCAACGGMWLNTCSYAIQAAGLDPRIPADHHHEWYRRALTQSKGAAAA